MNDQLTDKEIYKASTTIDKALLSMDKTNRGEVASRILSVVRNLNDHIADKVWSELRPDQPMSINKVASKFLSVSPYQFIARFDKFLRASVSHFTPSEEGAERLLIKYYRYILQLKKLLHDRYNMEIIQNIDYFLEDLDEQTKDYYSKVAAQIETTSGQVQTKNLDNYYADKQKINNLEDALTQQRRSKEQSDFLISEIKDKKTGLQIDLNALKERLSVEFNIELKDLIDREDAPEITEDQATLATKCSKLKKQLDEFGTINLMAKEAFDEMNERYDFINKEKADLIEAKGSLMATIKEIDDTAQVQFMFTFDAVRNNFVKVFRSLFNEEDSCDLVLTDPSNPLDSDIDIIARPKGKRPLSINQLSGGEKTLTSTALLFSLYLSKPAPFCIFDEVDAPLDDTNIDKFNNIIRDFSKNSQFIVVSHNKKTIASTDIIYGVTMVEQGVSRVVAVDLREVA